MSNLIKQEFLTPDNYTQAMQFAGLMAESDLVPKDYRGKPANILVAMQWGAELGIKPMQAMQNIAVINGRPSLWGDAVLAIVQQHPAYEWIKETDNGVTATCTVKRKGEDAHSATFSMEDAKKAGLSNKQGPWSQYPARMRQMRARGFALRDKFSDALKGMRMAEEVMDIPSEKNMGSANVISDIAKNLKAPEINISNVEPEAVNMAEIVISETVAPSLSPILTAIQSCENRESLNELVNEAKFLPEEDKLIAREEFSKKVKELKDAQTITTEWSDYE